jgi:hypothetical protein
MSEQKSVGEKVCWWIGASILALCGAKLIEGCEWRSAPPEPSSGVESCIAACKAAQ